MGDGRESAIAVQHLKRRRVLQACCGLALGGPVVARGDETDEANSTPQENDALVFAYGDRAGQIIAPADVVLGAKQTPSRSSRIRCIRPRNARATAHG
jgi:hypothetical protein